MISKSVEGVFDYGWLEFDRLGYGDRVRIRTQEIAAIGWGGIDDVIHIWVQPMGIGGTFILPDTPEHRALLKIDPKEEE